MGNLHEETRARKIPLQHQHVVSAPNTLIHIYERIVSPSHTHTRKHTYNMAAVEHFLFGKFCTKWIDFKLDEREKITSSSPEMYWLASWLMEKLLYNNIELHKYIRKHESTHSEHMFNRFSLYAVYSSFERECCASRKSHYPLVFSFNSCQMVPETLFLLMCFSILP